MRRFWDGIKLCFKSLSRFELVLWIGSLFCALLSFILGIVLSGQVNIASFIASIFGITAIIFNCKANVLGQYLMIIYTVISALVALFTNNYGVFFSFLFLSLPCTLIACVNWAKKAHVDGENKPKVAKVAPLTPAKIILLTIATGGIVIGFYFFLQHLPQLLPGASEANYLLLNALATGSCFAASVLMTMRSPYYALCFGVNDILLIVIWGLTCVSDIGVLPNLICVANFLINDSYGFFNWKRIEKAQKQAFSPPQTVDKGLENGV